LTDHKSVSWCLRDLRRGRRLLCQFFKHRFHGGYSAPFDGLPTWLPNGWKNIGGNFVSWIWNRPKNTLLPSVQISLDPWDWNANLLKSWNEISRHVNVTLRRTRRIGIVIHPQLLCDFQYRHSVEKLIEGCVNGGIQGAAISDVALTNQSRSRNTQDVGIVDR
jgi:hypothetical protein